MNLGKSIRIGLANKNLTKRWLSERLEVSPGYVSDLCNEKQRPNLERVEQMAQLFGVKVSEFIAWGE